MAFVLVRIDDRLIHGQVTLAWGSSLNPDVMVLVNNDVASTEWKRELYSTTDTMGVRIDVLGIDSFLDHLAKGRWQSEDAILVVNSAADLLALVRGGLSIKQINVGGMHFSDGKREVLAYVYVDDDDIRDLLDISDLGIAVEARDVPQSEPVDLVPKLLKLREKST